MRYSGIDADTPIPSDTNGQIDELRKTVGKELNHGGERIISMLVSIQKEQRKSSLRHDEHSRRISATEKDQAVLVARFADAIVAQNKTMGVAMEKLDSISAKVAFLDGEQTGIHAVQKTPPPTGDGVTLSVSQKVALALLSSGAGGAIAWVAAKLS
jgi:hypothetical protein